jgi:hypothetical protein
VIESPGSQGNTPVGCWMGRFTAGRSGMRNPLCPQRCCNARRLIHEARRLFAEWQECPPPVQVPLPEFLQTEFEQRWANAEVRSKPERTDAVLAHGLPVALEILGKKTTSTVSKGCRRSRPEPRREASQCVRCDDVPSCLQAFRVPFHRGSAGNQESQFLPSNHPQPVRTRND